MQTYRDALTIDNINPINKFDFDIRKCKPERPKLTRHMPSVMENKAVMLRSLQNFCMSCRMCELGCKLLVEKDIEFDPHVFSNMVHTSDFMVVGQNPGFNECQSGVPFIGAAGKNFDEELEKNGMDRNAFYITNVLKCHTLKNAKPERTHIEKCSKILDFEISIIRPTMIITLGASAFDFFCPDIKYSDGLGTVSESKYGKIFAVYHPSPLNVNNPSRRDEFNKQINLVCKIIKSLNK